MKYKLKKIESIIISIHFQLQQKTTVHTTFLRDYFHEALKTGTLKNHPRREVAPHNFKGANDKAELFIFW